MPISTASATRVTTAARLRIPIRPTPTWMAWATPARTGRRRPSPARRPMAHGMRPTWRSPARPAIAGTGLANPADASFSLVTSVGAGIETANASTDSRVVCDVEGNCATAGPIAGNKIDRKAPSITVTTPANGAVYPLQRKRRRRLCLRRRRLGNVVVRRHGRQRRADRYVLDRDQDVRRQRRGRASAIRRRRP